MNHLLLLDLGWSTHGMNPVQLLGPVGTSTVGSTSACMEWMVQVTGSVTTRMLS
jgi:hypothetical protein